MCWTSLIGPAVVAAVISGIVACIGMWISTRAAHRVHAEKLAFDREQAERRTTAEMALTKRKAVADIALAEKRFAFDKAFAVWRRRYDLAEQTLSAAYEARDALDYARVRVTFSGEGETRKPTQIESDELRAERNSFFVPVERLARNAQPFATLETLRYIVASHFGAAAVQPVSAIMEVHNDITSSAHTLIEMVMADEDRLSRESLMPLRNKLWGKRPDDNDGKLAAAIEQLEQICQPVLSVEPPA